MSATATVATPSPGAPAAPPGPTGWAPPRALSATTSSRVDNGAPPARRRFTVEEFLALPDTKGFELVDGELVEKPMGTLSSRTAVKLLARLDHYCESHAVGYVFESEQLYRCFPDAPSRLRKPDISLVRLGRFPDEVLPETIITIAPDLAVEVISPNDHALEVDRKVQEYLRAGVRLVWVINPNEQFVRVHRADRSVTVVEGDAVLSGEDVVPGFECRLSGLFPLPAGADADGPR